MAAPRRAPYGSAAIPTSRNDGNSIDRPTAAYNCVDRSPRAETQRPTRGYTAIEVAWLAMYTAKISGLPTPYDSFKKIGKKPQNAANPPNKRKPQTRYMRSACGRRTF